MKMLPMHHFILSKDKSSISSMKDFLEEIFDVFGKSKSVVPEIGFRGFPYHPFLCFLNSKVGVSHWGDKFEKFLERKGLSLTDVLDVFFSVHQSAMGFELKERELLSSRQAILLPSFMESDESIRIPLIIDEFIETWMSEEETFFLLSNLGRNENHVFYDSSLFRSKQDIIEWKDFLKRPAMKLS